MVENQRYKRSCYIQPHIAQCIFKYTDYFFHAYSENSIKVCGILNLQVETILRSIFESLLSFQIMSKSSSESKKIFSPTTL